MNSVTLVGRIISDIVINEIDGKECSMVQIGVERPYKNEIGEYGYDIIPCVLWNGIASNTEKYCKKGDIMGIKGRLEILDDKLVIIAEKVSFLSKSKEESKGE